MRHISLIFAAFLILAGLALGQASQIHSVSSLPATCNPGAGIGGSMADHIDLWNGVVNVPYFCSSSNTWTQAAFGVAGPGTSTVGHIPTWNDSVGGSLADSGFAFPLDNAQLVNSATTVNGQTCTLGSTCTVSAAPSGTASGTDINGTYPSSLTVVGFNSVPLCTGFTWANGDGLKKTTASSPNPCVTTFTPSTFSNPLTTTGDLIYGVGSTATRLAGPTSPNGVPSILTSFPSGGVAVAPSWNLPGIVGRSVTGASDTILSTDCNPKRIAYTGASAVAVTLPTPSTLGVSNCTLKLANNTTNTVTITPTTWTISAGSGATPASSLALLEGQEAVIFVDPLNATNWAADVIEQGLSVSGGLTATRAVSGLTIGAAAGTMTTTGSPANGNLAKFSGSATATNGDLSGDCTTSGTLSVSCTQMGSNFTVDRTSGNVTTLSANSLVNSGVGGEIYGTSSGTQSTSFGPTTMVATTPASTMWYRISFYAEQVALGTSCTGNSTIQVQVGFQGPNAAGSSNIAVGTAAIITNGAVGRPAQFGGGTLGQAAGSYVFPVKASTSITYSAVFTAGSGCSPSPTFSVTPILEQL